MGRGPARPMKFSEDGPRPDPTHQCFKSSRPGPARPINSSNVSARPGPADHIFKSLGPAPSGPLQVSDRPGPDKRPMASPRMNNLTTCPPSLLCLEMFGRALCSPNLLPINYTQAKITSRVHCRHSPNLPGTTRYPPPTTRAVFLPI